MATKIEYMARAIRLARKGLNSATPNPRVGCVIVNNNKVVGQGFHLRAGKAHAEINALQDAGKLADGSDVFVTLEPCSHHGKTPPCAEALIRAHVSRVYIALNDPNPLVAGKGVAMLRKSGIEVFTGLLENQSRQLNPGYIKRMLSGYPLVICKMAMSLDARTSMASGESKWITGSEARQDVHRLRARCCAILTGSGTVLADNPSLNWRLELEPENRSDVHPVEPPDYQPIRVIVDSHLRTPADANIIALPGKTLIFHSADQTDKEIVLKNAGAKLIKTSTVNGMVDLHQVLKQLAQLGVNEVMVEAGPTLSGKLIELQLVDELRIYMAAHIMGDAANGLFHLPEIQRMNQRVPFKILDIRSMGEDWRITAKPLQTTL